MAPCGYSNELCVLWVCGSDQAAGCDGTRLPALLLPGLGAAVQRARRRRAEPDLPASDLIAFVVLCRLRYRLTLRDLSEILALRGIKVSSDRAAKQIDERD